MQRVLYIIYFPLIAMGLAAGSTNSIHVGAGAVLNAVAWPLLYAVSIAIHEGGHAFVANALGLRVTAIRVGTGKKIHEFTSGGVRIGFHRFPVGGATSIYPGEARSSLKLKLWLSIAAGPVATFGLLLLLLMIGHWGWLDVVFPYRAAVQKVSLLRLTATINLWLLFWNTVPFAAKASPTNATDGTKLIVLPFISSAGFEQWIAAEEIQAVQPLIDAKDYVAARERLALIRAKFPKPEILDSLDALGSMLDSLEGNYEQARDGYLRVLEKKKAAKQPLPWMLTNNIAWADFILRRDELKQEADELSHLAIRTAPNLPHTTGTRAAVLWWLGHSESAVLLARRAFETHDSERGQALNACTLCLAYCDLNERAEAKKWLEIAVKLDPSASLLGEARRSLESSEA